MFWILFRCCLLDEANVVALQHDTTEGPAFRCGLDVVFFSVIENEIHVLVESNDSSFDSQVDVLEDPDANSRAVLEVTEDQVDGLHHNYEHEKLLTLATGICSLTYLSEPSGLFCKTF